MSCDSGEGGGSLALYGVYFSPSVFFILTASWGIASFALLPSPERCAQASLGETVTGTETRNVLEEKTVESSFGGGGYAGHTRRECEGTRHPGQYDVSS